MIRAEVPWDKARRFFFWRLRRRLAERALVAAMRRSLPTTLDDEMVIRYDHFDIECSHGRWKRPCLQTAHMTI